MNVTPDTIMVIDEPDLHIHSVLQKRMIEYMRERANQDNVQFIIATHSPVIINEASSEETFVLVEKSRAGNENQPDVELFQAKKNLTFSEMCAETLPFLH